MGERIALGVAMAATLIVSVAVIPIASSNDQPVPWPALLVVWAMVIATAAAAYWPERRPT